jgi:transcriptional regulator with XRE-family HTH domain
MATETMSDMDAYRNEVQRLLAQFGGNVRKARTRLKPHVSQERLAQDTQLHRTEVNRIEQGLVNPRLTTLLILAEGLNVTMNELAEGLNAPVERRPSQTGQKRS